MLSIGTTQAYMYKTCYLTIKSYTSLTNVDHAHKRLVCVPAILSRAPGRCAAVLAVCACVCVCVSVCVCVCVRARVCDHFLCTKYLQRLRRNFMKFCGEDGRAGSGKNRLDFGGDPDSFVCPGSFSRILYHYQPSSCS